METWLVHGKAAEINFALQTPACRPFRLYDTNPEAHFAICISDKYKNPALKNVISNHSYPNCMENQNKSQYNILITLL